jgi:hypothetical protein
MRRREAEKLLGGFATGTLTEAERRGLFTAALEDQVLFNALADEEALRELLADPEARQALLARLAEKDRRPVVPFWRRPTALGVAASLMVATLAGLAYLRSPEHAARRSLAQEASRPGTTAPAPAAAAVPALAAPERPAKLATPATAPRETAKLVTEAKVAEARQQNSLDRAGTARAKAEAAPSRKDEPVAEGVARAPMPSQAQIPMPASVPTRASGQVLGGAISADAYRRTEAPKPASSAAVEVVGATRGAGALEYGQEASKAKKVAASKPVWYFEPAPGERARLKVAWPSSQYLYLLKRGPSGVEVLKPGFAHIGEEGLDEATFEFRWGSQEVLDLYLTGDPVKTPATLPAEGPFTGFRRRIQPAEN